MNKNYINPIIFLVLFLTFIVFLPIASFANGGDQRVVGGKYLINLSRSPFTPKVGEKTAMIASFVNIQTDKIIDEDIIVKVRIAKVGGENGRSFTFEQDNLRVRGGILEFPYTFQDAGLHEIFFDFAFMSEPQKIYNVPDFLLDIQKPGVSEKPNRSILIWIGLSAFFGFGIGWLVKQKLTK